ncbi:MAG: MBL fold metallo-hydrolase [Prolixibacteraceae bacterium]
MRFITLLIIGVLILSGQITLASKTVVKKITNDVIVVSPDKKQLHTLGWPNDIINSIAVNTKQGIVLIDTQNSPANARLIKAAIIDYFNDSTFFYIINTHGHSCHSGGNCIFDLNNIVAQKNSAQEIKNYDDLFLGQTVEFLRKEIYHKTILLDTVSTTGVFSDSINEAIDLYKFYENDLINNYKARYPDLTFDENMTLTAGNKTILLNYMGEGHGNADITVYIKEDKLLCTGNLFHLGSYKEEAMPSFYQGRNNDIDHWISTLETVLNPQNAIDQVISTHGKHPFKRENMEFILAYCKEVKSKVREAKSTNQSLESVQNIENFNALFDQYKKVISINDNVKEMHARNIGIIWKYVQ